MKYILLLISSSLTFILISAAGASPITFTMTGVASGRLGTSTFQQADYTITAIADTSQITSANSVLSVIDELATISIAGVGTATITTPFFTYVNHGDSEAGFYYGNIANRPELMNSAFSTYGLASALGPLSGTSTAVSGLAFDTSDGVFDPAPLSIQTFQASLVPDRGATLFQLGLGILALAAFQSVTRKMDGNMNAAPNG
jgi:hypothetical protein